MVNNAQIVFTKDALTRRIIFGYLNISTETRVKNICKKKCDLQISYKKRINYDINRFFYECANYYPKYRAREVLMMAKFQAKNPHNYNQIDFRIREKNIVNKHIQNMLYVKKVRDSDILSKNWVMEQLRFLSLNFRHNKISFFFNKKKNALVVCNFGDYVIFHRQDKAERKYEVGYCYNCNNSLHMCECDYMSDDSESDEY